MTFPKARLAVAACLFIGWIGFLLYQVIAARAIVLSKPQFLTAQLWAVVEASAGGRGDPYPHRRMTVEEVLWSARAADRQLARQEIDLPDFATCWNGQQEGYRGEGKYVLPLVQGPSGWMIAPVPRLMYDPRKPATHGTLEAVGVFSRRARRRISIGEARRVKQDWESAGYDVTLTEEELRVYPLTADTRAQVNELIAARER